MVRVVRIRRSSNKSLSMVWLILSFVSSPHVIPLLDKYSLLYYYCQHSFAPMQYTTNDCVYRSSTLTLFEKFRNVSSSNWTLSQRWNRNDWRWLWKHQAWKISLDRQCPYQQKSELLLRGVCQSFQQKVWRSMKYDQSNNRSCSVLAHGQCKQSLDHPWRRVFESLERNCGDQPCLYQQTWSRNLDSELIFYSGSLRTFCSECSVRHKFQVGQTAACKKSNGK